MVSWRQFWVTLGAVVTAGVGGLPLRFGVDPVKTVIALLVVATAAAWVASAGVGRAVMFRDTAPSSRNVIVKLIWVAIAVHAALVVAAQVMPERWLTWLFVLFGLAVAEYLVGEFRGYWIKTAPVATKAGPLDLEYTPQDDTSQVFRAGLHRAGLGTLVIDGWEPVGDKADE